VVGAPDFPCFRRWRSPPGFERKSQSQTIEQDFVFWKSRTIENTVNHLYQLPIKIRMIVVSNNNTYQNANIRLFWTVLCRTKKKTHVSVTLSYRPLTMCDKKCDEMIRTLAKFIDLSLAFQLKIILKSWWFIITEIHF